MAGITPWDVQSKRVFTPSDVSPTLQAGCGNAKQIMPIVMIERGGRSRESILMRQREGKPGGGKGPLLQTEVSGTLATRNDQILFDGRKRKYIVRRITATEAERLQGFQDGHTDLTGCDVDAVTEKVAASLGYDDRQKASLRRKVKRWSDECPDGPRYKACGNSFAVPCVAWIGSRIQQVIDMIEKKDESGRD